jgi:hypothetical protein
MIELRDEGVHIIVSGNGEGANEWGKYWQILEQLYCMTMDALGWPR